MVNRQPPGPTLHAHIRCVCRGFSRPLVAALQHGWMTLPRFRGRHTECACYFGFVLATLIGIHATRADDTDLLEQRAFRAAVDRVAPSVVQIETVGGLQRIGKLLTGTGPTTGLVVGADGHIVSSAFAFLHRPDSILVRLPDGTRKPAELIATDHSRMVVLLKIKPDGPLPVPETAAEKDIRVGQWAIAVGRTFDVKRTNVAVGIVSAVGRIWGKALQTDAAVSPNNYGGPLVDVRGRVLGVLVPLSPHSAKEIAGYEWYDSGIGFAVPAEQILGIVPRLRKGEDLYPGVIGINLRAGNPALGEAVIMAVRPNSPAYDAGLKEGDKIVEIDGCKIVRIADLKRQFGRHYAGDKVRLVLLRNDKRITRELELVARLEPYEHPFLGILPMRDAPGPGVTVRYVYPDSPAAKAGIEAGDVLVSLGGKPIEDRDELLRRIDAFQPGDEIELQLRRGKKIRKVKPALAPQPESLPPEKLSPARKTVKPFEGERPAVGVVPLKIPELKNDAWAYVPGIYNPKAPHGVVVWLHAPDAFDWDKSLSRWQPHCDAGELIFLAPKSADPKRWTPAELTLVRKLLDEIGSTYTIDPARVVVVGREGGGTLASLAAFRNRELVRGLALIDAPLAGPPGENEPLKRLAVYVAKAAGSDKAKQIERSITALREKKFPVTEKDLGKKPRDLNDDELSELARWIDTLDRI